MLLDGGKTFTVNSAGGVGAFNTLNVTGSGGTLAGGYSPAFATVNLAGGSTLTSTANPLNFNTLNVRGANATYTGTLNAAVKTLNFYLPSTLAAGGTMLGVTGTANIGGSTVNVGIAGSASPLRAGDAVVLINATGGLTGTPANTTSKGTGMQGVTLLYDFDLSTTPNELLATVSAADSGSSGGPRVNPQTKALAEGFAGGLALAEQGADHLAGKGVAGAVEAAGGKTQGPKLAEKAGAGGYGFGTFGSISAASLRYNTGSHVDLSGLNLIAGLSLGADLPPGRLTLGAFFEWGNGSYTTYNSFSNAASVSGDGNSSQLGGGVLARMDFVETGPGHAYAEGSFRAGGIRNWYASSDLRDAWGRGASYEAFSGYYGAHAGLGYLWNITEAASLDLYGKYFWTRQTGTSLRLSTGDPVDFKDADSHRLRLGGRFAYAVNDFLSPYLGAAYEREFDGRARATTNGYDLGTPSLKGDTGIGELGLTVKPSKDLPLSFDLGVQGYVGKREGVSGSLQAKWEF